MEIELWLLPKNMKTSSRLQLSLWIFLLVFSFVLNGLLWFGAHQYFTPDSTTTVLHYNADFGIDFIGDSSNINVLPQIGVILCLFNLLVGLAIFRVEPRSAWVLWFTSPFLQIGLAISLYVIWRINN